MHFSALTVLACALVAVNAHSAHDAAVVVAPVSVKNVANGNNIAAGNDILNSHPKRGDVASVWAPVKATNILNHNTVNAANHVGRGAVDVKAPITITDILNCNNVQIANDILNHLAVEVGCTVAELGITVKDILDAKHENIQSFLERLSATLRHLLGKRNVVDVEAPISVTKVLDCNKISIANDILNHLAIEVGCTVAQLGVAPQEIVAAKTNEAVQALEAKLSAAIKKVQAKGKRSAVAVYAPVTLKDILNCNTVKIANDLLNHLALELKCTVSQLGITVADLLAARPDNADALLATLKAHIAKLSATEKRDAANVKAPVDVSNVANYNVVDVLNNVGNAKGGKRDGAKVVAPVKVAYVLNNNDVKAANNVLNGGKRDAANVKAPVDITNVANYNVVDVLNHVASGDAPQKRDAADVKAPVGITNVANYNVVDVLNNVGNHDGKRDLLDLDAPVTATDIGNGNDISILNWILNGHGKRDDGVDAFIPVTVTNAVNDNTVNLFNDVLN